MAKLTKLDAARQLGIARSTLYKLIDQGHVSPTPDGFIDQAELVRVAAYVDTLKERTRTGTDRRSRPRTDADTGQRDTHPGHEDGQIRPRTSVSGQTETGAGGQTRTVTDMLVDMLREQLQAAQAREQAAVEREQAAREREALLLQMLQQMQHRYDRLFEAPRRAPAPPTPATPVLRAAPGGAPEAPADRGAMRRRILALVRDYPDGLTPVEIRVLLHATKRLSNTCIAMRRDGLLHRVDHGRYVAGPGSGRD